MKAAFYPALFCLMALLQTGLALATDAAHSSPFLPTALSPEEIQREDLDTRRYPNFMGFIKTVDLAKGLQKSDPRNSAWIKTAYVYVPQLPVWKAAFRAAAADHLTCLKMFAIFARHLKKLGVVVFGPGSTFERAVSEEHVDLGLAMPAHHIGMAVWHPDPSNHDPEFMLHLKIFYTEPFVHRFPDEILPANLKIGYGPEESYWMEGKEYHQHTVDADVYYGPTKGIGFRNVKGIGGQKRGIAGVFQKILFFLPDAVDAMTIDEKNNQMITEALMNTKVKDFETNPLYSIKLKP